MIIQESEGCTWCDIVALLLLLTVTGRNIHALDPYRMPGPAAEARGAEAAEAILQVGADI
jgi:hypothetical protein